MQTFLKFTEINLLHLVGTILTNISELPNTRHHAKYLTYVILFTLQPFHEIVLLSSLWPRRETEAHPIRGGAAT